MLAVFVPAANTHGEVTQKPMQTSQHQLITFTHQPYSLYLLIGHYFAACRTLLGARKWRRQQAHSSVISFPFSPLKQANFTQEMTAHSSKESTLPFLQFLFSFFDQSKLPSLVISLKDQQLLLSFPLL